MTTTATPSLPSRRENASVNADEYHERRLLLRSLPTIVYVELTQNCNLHCVMCRVPRRYDPSKDMAADIFDAVARQLMPTATVVDLRGWGESTILKHFEASLERVTGTGV